MWRNGLRSSLKHCGRKAYGFDSRHRDMANSNEYMREYMLRRYHDRRNEAIDLLGGACASCLTGDDLEFDHIDPEMKRGEIAKLWSYRYDKFIAELAKCQLLCRDCHIKKTREDLGVDHGGGKSGKFITENGKRRACPCNLCKAKKKQYMKEYMQGYDRNR